MATLTIVVPDGAVTRITNAFGTSDIGNTTRTPATLIAIQTQIKEWVQGRVTAYERQVTLAAVIPPIETPW